MDSSPHQLLPGHPGGACKSKVKRICEWLLQVLLSFLCLQLVTGNLEAICNDGEEMDPQAPECLDDCRGRRFFLGIDQLCKMCIQCQPGYEHDKECGNGVNGDAVCVQCPEDHYSYNLYDCVGCRVCENTLITQECSVSTDRQCGECLPGFYKDPQNPDLCNQRCEWLSNPETIPACKEWLEGQQVTSLSADISMTSSFPGIIDEGIGREATIIIIIIVLVVVIIGGSVIPVYMFCKHFKYTRSKRTDVLLAASEDKERGNPREPFPAADAFTGIDGDGDNASMNIGTTVPQETCTGVVVTKRAGETPRIQRVSEVANGVSLSAGPQQVNTSGDVTEMDGALMMPETSEVVVDNAVRVASGSEQEIRFVKDEEDDKDHDKSFIYLFNSNNGIAYTPNDLSFMSDSQEEEGKENVNSIFPNVSAERSDSNNKVVHGVSENESSADEYDPSPNSHGGKFKDDPLEISLDTQAPGSSNMAQTLRSTESTGISPRDNAQRPRGLDSEGTQGTLGVAGNDEQYGEAVTGREEPDESERLLSDVPLESRDSPVISQVEDELLAAGQEPEVGGRNNGAEVGDEEEDEGDGSKEGLDEHDTLLQNSQVKDLGEKNRPHTTNTLQMPSCDNCGNQPKYILNIKNVHNLVLNDQINHHHHNGE